MNVTIIFGLKTARIIAALALFAMMASLLPPSVFADSVSDKHVSSESRYVHKDDQANHPKNENECAVQDDDHTIADDNSFDGVTISEVVINSCGVQNVVLSGTIMFGIPTSHDSFVMKLDGEIVRDDEDIDDTAPDGVWQNWTQTLTNLAVGEHIIEVIIFENDIENTDVKSAQTVTLIIPTCEHNDGDSNDHDEVVVQRLSSSSGTRVTKRALTGAVLGASTSTPTGVVLGAATTTLPVGAPNTGAGGTALAIVNLPTVSAILPKTQKIK